MFDYEKNIIKMFDKEGTEEAIKDKKDFLWFTFIETEKELKAELDSEEYTLSEYQKDKIMNLLQKLEFLAREL